MVTQSETGESSLNNRIYNNVFHASVTSGIDLKVANAGTLIANNVFLSNPRGIFLDHGGSGTAVGVDAFLPMFESHHNLFFDNEADYLLRPDWTGPGGSGTGYTLDEMTSTHGIEQGSLSGDPMFVEPSLPDFHLKEGSPAAGAGDGLLYGAETVDMGMYPLPEGSAGGSGAGGSAGSGGVAGSGGAAGTGGAAGKGADAEADDGGGCGCVAVGGAPTHMAWLAVLLLAALRRRERE